MFTEPPSFWRAIPLIAMFSLVLVEVVGESVMFGGGAPQTGDPGAAWLADLLSSRWFVVGIVGFVLLAMTFSSFARWVVNWMPIILAGYLAVLQDRLGLWLTYFVLLLGLSVWFHFLYRVSTRLFVFVLVFTTAYYLLERSAF